MFDLHVFKAIWRIRTLKKGLHVFRGTQSNQSHLLVDAVDALGRVAEALKCEELVQWTKNELDGYAADETVPAYRHVGCEYRGDALKCGQALQKDYLLPEEVWRQHLPVTNNTFEYKGGLSAMLDIVRDSTQATCVLRSYRDFQVVNVYNLQAGYEVIGPRCVCSRHDVLNMLTAVSAKCESHVREIEGSHPCLWKVAGAFDWILKHWKIVGLILLLALVGSLIFCHRKNRRNSEFQSSVACFLRTVPAGNGSDTSKFRMVQVMANDGNPDAQCDLGMMYADGTGCKKDEKESIEWFYKAAERGSVEALFRLGVAYEISKGVTQDLTRACYYYLKAGEKGHSFAQYNLGNMHRAGRPRIMV